MPCCSNVYHKQRVHQRRRTGPARNPQWLEELVPHEPISHYRYNRTGEDNGDAHLKRQIMGREVVVAITDGRLDDPAEPSGRA